VVECGQTPMRRARLLSLTVLVALCAAAPGPVFTAPPDARPAALLGACYCRAAGNLKCVGVVTRVECTTQCAEALCDDWFWMERLNCWNWGYGG
jgi:hypothetical protein